MFVTFVLWKNAVRFLLYIGELGHDLKILIVVVENQCHVYAYRQVLSLTLISFLFHSP